MLTARAEIELADLAVHTWIAPGASARRDALAEACRRAGFAPDVAAETNNYQAMLRMVGAGVGVAVVPRLVASMAPAGSVVLRPLARTRLERVVSVVYRTQAALTPAMQLMNALLAEAAAADGCAVDVGRLTRPARNRTRRRPVGSCGRVAIGAACGGRLPSH